MENHDHGAKRKCTRPGRGISEADRDYLAGLFDGEGCVTIALNSSPQGFRHVIACLLTLTVSGPVRLLAELLGGRVYGPIKRPDRQDQFRWEASPKVAISALRVLMPALRVKRRQAELVYFFQEHRSRPVTPAELCWRDQLRRKIHCLNGNKRRRRNVLPEETLAIGPTGRKRLLPKESSVRSTPTLAYLAGLFDAEGCITVELLKQKVRRQSLHRLFCKVAMTDKHACELFLQRFGGELQGPFQRKDRQQMYRWRIDANKAASFLREIRPFMLVKHKQADLGLELQDDWIRSNPTSNNEFERRESIRQAISSLNGIKKVRALPATPNDSLAQELEAKRDKFKRFLELDARGLSSKLIAEELDTWPESITRWRRKTPAYARDLV